MNDQTMAVIIAVCGIVSVLVLLAGLIVLRLLRFSVFGFANMIMRMLAEPKDEADVAKIQAHAVAHTSTDSLRAKAEQVASFEAAVEQHRQEQELENSAGALLEPKPFVPETPDLSSPLPNIRSPIFGRIFRDGRFRRMAAGTPGRESNEDFRRADGRDEPIEGA